MQPEKPITAEELREEIKQETDFIAHLTGQLHIAFARIEKLEARVDNLNLRQWFTALSVFLIAIILIILATR